MQGGRHLALAVAHLMASVSYERRYASLMMDFSLRTPMRRRTESPAAKLTSPGCGVPIVLCSTTHLNPLESNADRFRSCPRKHVERVIPTLCGNRGAAGTQDVDDRSRGVGLPCLLTVLPCNKLSTTTEVRAEVMSLCPAAEG